MNTTDLAAIAKAMVAPGKGILAADESAPTCKKRFDSINVESTAENRRAYRELLVTVPGGNEFISGVILYDETMRQSTSQGVLIPDALKQQGILPGIKVDTGAMKLAGSPNEKITEGLDGLRERLVEYKKLGACFAKWRAVITIGTGIPSARCIEANAHALARYAALCQESNLVPIVEPEVLMDGDHDIERCFDVTQETLHQVFHALHRQCVALEGVILKASMVISGSSCATQASVQDVATATVRCLNRTVPAAIPGVVFLSGGQSEEIATAHLNAMNQMGPHAWPLSFSFGRALQAPALKAWRGSKENVRLAQSALYHREKCNSAACFGRYTPQMEKQVAA
jgi:fructose-bisphosphate aldolase, class I